MMNFSKFKTWEILSLPVEAPIKETYRFVTDVIETFNGIEERHKMRGVPKQTFNYSLVANAKNNSEFFTQLQENVRKDWAIPIWSEIQKVDNILEGDTSFEVSEFSNDFIVGNSVFVYRFCTSNWLAFDIVKMEKGKVTINKPFPIDISTCYIMPLKKAWIEGSVTKNTNGISSKPTATFVMYDVSNFEANVPPLFNGYPLRDLPTLLNGSETSRTVSMRQDIADFDTGVVEWRTTWKKSRYVTNLFLTMFTKKELFEVKELLFTQGGRFLSFWLPTYESVAKITNIAGSEIFCNRGFIENNKLPFNICLHLTDSIQPATIVDIEEIDEDSIKLIASRRIDIDFEDFNYMSYLKLSRLDSDTFNIEYNAGVNTSLNTTITETNS